jgi:hypothetical protein
MSTLDIDKFYVSPYDKFLREFDVKHEKSASQIQEIEKHKRIAQLRDYPIEEQAEGKIWAQF